MYKVLIFDFDGVILESLDVKTKAFLKVYDEYPECADIISKYHLQNGGVSRYDKFIYINKNILDIPINEANIEEMANTFSEAVFDEILRCPFVEGALEFIKKYSQISKLYIASGTPDDELKQIVEKRDISGYFEGIYGTPKTKAEIILDIIESECICNDDVCFIGDAITDYDGAQKAGVPFIARINGETPDNPFLKMDVISINDLNELNLFFEENL